MKNPDISIIIVHYNTPVLLKECLVSLYKYISSQITVEIIVVDNGSTSEHKKELREVIGHFHTKLNLNLIQNKENLGFSKANNIGIRASHGAYVLLLNSDTQLQDAVLTHAFQYMEEHTEVYAYTPKLILQNGDIDSACHRGFPTPWASLCYFTKLEQLFGKTKLFGGYHQTYKNMDSIHEIDCPSGAFFLVRKNALDRIGLLDERFFMYGEDIDLAYRLRQTGGRIIYDPTYVVLHKKKQSGRNNADWVLRKKTQRHFYEAMLLFYDKWYEKTYSPVVSWLVHTVLHIKIGN